MLQDKPSTPKNIISIDNFIFASSASISVLICYFTLGSQNIVLSIIAVMFSYVIFSAKPNNGNYLYTFVWLVIILMGCFVGSTLKLSWLFYLFLFIVSSYYYVSFNKDVFSDRAIPFLVIYASLGTTIDGLSFKSVVSFLIGSVVALIVMRIVHKQKVEFSAFKTGLFSKMMYIHPPHIFLNAIIYSLLLFLCLYLPDNLGLQRAYWAPMTFIILLKPKDNNTITNTIQRFLGSLLGVFTVFLVLDIDQYLKGFNWFIIAICVFLLPSFFKLPNLFKAFGITVFVIILLESVEFSRSPNYLLPYARIYETFIGGSLAIIGSIILKGIRKLKRIQ